MSVEIEKLIEVYRATPSWCKEPEGMITRSPIGELLRAVSAAIPTLERYAKMEAWALKQKAECEEKIAHADKLCGVGLAADGWRKRLAELQEILK